MNSYNYIKTKDNGEATSNISFIAPRGNQKSTAAIRTLFGLEPIELTEINIEEDKCEFYEVKI